MDTDSKNPSSSQSDVLPTSRLFDNWIDPIDVLVSKPERDHRGVDAGVQQSHCRGMPQDMHGHRFLHQRRTDAAGHLHVFGEPMFESVATERFAGARHEERSRLARSASQTRRVVTRLDVSGVIRCFRPVPWQLTYAPAARWTSAHRRPISSDARRPVCAARPKSVWSRRPVQVDRSGQQAAH